MWTRSTQLGALLALPAVPAERAGAQEIDDEVDYADQGTFELGGNFDVSLVDSVFRLDTGPTVGVFVSDNVELSALLRLSYLRDELGDEAASGSFVLEPSYHLPLAPDEVVFVFGGLGVGAGFAAGVPDLELVPRIGIDTRIGSAGVLTPAVRMPIVYRWNTPAPYPPTSLGLAFEVGVKTMF